MPSFTRLFQEIPGADPRLAELVELAIAKQAKLDAAAANKEVAAVQDAAAVTERAETTPHAEEIEELRKASIRDYEAAIRAHDKTRALRISPRPASGAARFYEVDYSSPSSPSASSESSGLQSAKKHIKALEERLDSHQASIDALSKSNRELHSMVEALLTQMLTAPSSPSPSTSPTPVNSLASAHSILIGQLQQHVVSELADISKDPVSSQTSGLSGA